MDVETNRAIRRPRALPRDGHIRVVAPASGFPREAFEDGVARLRQHGYRVSWRPDIFEREHYLAGSVRRRVDELHEAFADPAVDAILCARGGYGSMQLLSALDVDVLRRHPKIFVGCSDLTPLLNFCVQKLGFITFHGPMVAGMGRVNAQCQSSLFDLMEGRLIPESASPGYPQPDPYRLEAQSVNHLGLRGPAPLCGGNLSMIAATIGTPLELDTRGCILCLEDVGERPYRVDRLLTQLKLAGKLDEVAAIAFGTFTDCEEPGGQGRSVLNLLQQLTCDLEVPVVTGMPFGHGHHNFCVPLGAMAILSEDGWMNILGPVVESPSSAVS